MVELLCFCLCLSTLFHLSVEACTAAPSLQISIGINTTVGSTLTTITCTSAASYKFDITSDGYTYFSITNSGVVTLVNRLDVEYGLVAWNVLVKAYDSSNVTTVGTATLTFQTFQSTTTTTSTQPPPGYDWLAKKSNMILFACVMACAGLITGLCILMCIRFHRVGTCLPSSYPEFKKLKASFNRQMTCCPLPCDFYNNSDTKQIQIEEAPDTEVNIKPFGLPSAKVKKDENPQKPNTSFDYSSDRVDIVSPVIIGNVKLSDVGFDGMRSPGFNAPMFTSYGGKKNQPAVKRKS